MPQFQAIIDAQAPQTSRHYPVAAASINMTTMLARRVHLDADSSTSGGRGVAQIKEPFWGVFTQYDAFFELFCLTLRLFDRVWASTGGRCVTLRAGGCASVWLAFMVTHAACCQDRGVQQDASGGRRKGGGVVECWANVAGAVDGCGNATGVARLGFLHTLIPLLVALWLCQRLVLLPCGQGDHTNMHAHTIPSQQSYFPPPGERACPSVVPSTRSRPASPQTLRRPSLRPQKWSRWGDRPSDLTQTCVPAYCACTMGLLC